YVTHDYQEALALGDRIGVLREGRLVQVGTPTQVWTEPVNTFVARRRLGERARLRRGGACPAARRRVQARARPAHRRSPMTVTMDAPPQAQRLRLEALRKTYTARGRGDGVTLTAASERVHLFDPASGQRLR
ncbi:MAG TPA: hypothetical protein VFE39_17700, partial [Pseudonocardia sp.]|nr:hypothetical protein [Pseudonocardia sp.]